MRLALSDASAADETAFALPAWQSAPADFRLRVSGLSAPARMDLRFELPADGCAAPALFLGLADQSFEVWVNGDLVYASGDLAAGSKGVSDWPRPFHLVDVPRSNAGVRLAELRFYSGTAHIGVLGSGLELGCRSEFIQRIVREDGPRFMIGGLALLAMLISVGASFRARRIVAIRSFSLLCACIGAFIISNRTLRLQYILYDSLPFWFAIETVSTYFAPPAMILFVRSSIGQSRSINTLLIFSLTSFAGILLMSASGFPAYRNIHFHYGLAFVCLFWLVICAWRAPARHSHTARYNLGGLLVFALSVAYDILGSSGWVPWSAQVLSYGFFVMLLFLAAGTATRNHAVEQQIQEYQRIQEDTNRRLRDMVRRRTAWLRNSLRKVNHLRERQESDYYLTARIMEPIRFRGLHFGRVNITGYVEQQKKYRYQQWSGDVGGDVCMASLLRFGNDAWLTFVNADAMGKSLQGAGGAIVLATSFQAIVNRPGTVPADSRTERPEPEQWLRDCYRELQEVFQTFAGRMSSSAIVGLIHARTGAGLYVNASHPPPVLLQGSFARLVHDTRSPLLGAASGSGAEPGINRFQLQAGDMLLLGSDGREDVIADSNDARSRCLLSPELFPEIVARSHGDLERIVLRLEDLGHLADDLSLLRIEFH